MTSATKMNEGVKMIEGEKMNEGPVNWGGIETARWQREAMKVNMMARKHRKDGDETVH